MSLILIESHLRYAAVPPCELLLQIEAFGDDTQVIRSANLDLNGGTCTHMIDAEPDIGPRRWIDAGESFDVRYTAQIDVNRPDVDMSSLAVVPRHDLPGNVIPYLMPSRYCQSDLFMQFAGEQFGHLEGGAKVAAMDNWIRSNFRYQADASFVGATATDSFQQQAGVCRDYAHVLISLARAGGVPARFVSAYGPDVSPQDFHAVVEVYLEGGWHLADSTGMSKPSETVRICVGRDAADASFLTSYGQVDLIEQSVSVARGT